MKHAIFDSGIVPSQNILFAHIQLSNAYDMDHS